MKYKLEWKESNVYVKFYGLIDFDDIINASNKIIGNIKFYSLEYAIYDYLDVTEYNLGMEEVSVIATLNRSAAVWNQNVKLALVDNDEYISKMLIEYISLMDDVEWEIEHFKKVDDAINWCLKKITT